MSKKLALLLAVGVAALFGAATALADDSATPVSPDDASALIAGPMTSGASTASVVDPSVALAAASIPGAVTSVESDLTPEQAVGLAPDPTSSPTAAAPRRGVTTAGFALPKVCWSQLAWGQWGIWPYQQRLTDTTYWCAVYGSKITYRTSSVTGGGMLCGLGWRANQLIAGGVGFPYFTTRSSAGFDCPTDIPWIVLHPNHHLDVRRDSRGVQSIVGSG